MTWKMNKMVEVFEGSFDSHEWLRETDPNNWINLVKIIIQVYISVGYSNTYKYTIGWVTHKIRSSKS